MVFDFFVVQINALNPPVNFLLPFLLWLCHLSWWFYIAFFCFVKKFDEFCQSNDENILNICSIFKRKMLLNQIIKIDVIDDLAVVGNLNLVNVVVTFVSIAPSKDTKVLLNNLKGFWLKQMIKECLPLSFQSPFHLG